MALHLSYNLRNLIERKTTTAMTALGIALSAAVLMTVLALMSGLHAALSATGDPRNVIVMRKGSVAEMTSSLSRQEFQDLLFTPGIAVDESGKHPLASLEIVSVVNLGGEGLKGGSNINLRGLLSSEIPLHDVRQVSPLLQGVPGCLHHLMQALAAASRTSAALTEAKEIVTTLSRSFQERQVEKALFARQC